STYHFLQGELLGQRGEFKEALAEYEKAAQYDPGSTQLLLKIAQTKLALRDPAGAEKAAKQIFQIDSENFEAHLLLGKIYYATGREAESIESFGRAVKANPDNLEALLFYGTLLAENMYLDEAVEVLTHVLEINPDVDIVHFSLGKIYQEQGKWDLAENHYRRTIELNPGFKAAYAEILKVFQAEGQPEKAAEIYREILLNVGGDDVTLKAQIGELLFEQKKLDEAADVFETIKKDDPLNPRALSKLGLIYLEQERYADAVSQFQLLLAANPENDAVRYYLALSYNKLSKNDLARETLELIRPESKIYPDAVSFLAYLDDGDGQLDAALERIENARQQVDTSGQIRLLRMEGDILRKAKRTDDAIRVFEEAAVLAPDDPDLHFALGVAWDQKKDMDKMLASMRRVLEINPSHALALNYIGYTWADKGMNLEEAEKMIRQATALKPGDGYITDSLGWVYYRQGKLEEAARTLEEAVRLAPEDAQIVAHLGEVYQKLNRLPEALAAFEQALSLAKEEDQKLKEDVQAAIKAIRKKLKRS
ncbi:MAG: tetratricopeptide repeat protein, partial [Bdellovibrionota bacterium]